jgi:hypothetical protein
METGTRPLRSVRLRSPVQSIANNKTTMKQPILPKHPLLDNVRKADYAAYLEATAQLLQYLRDYRIGFRLYPIDENDYKKGRAQ